MSRSLDPLTLARILNAPPPDAASPPIRGATHHSGRVREGDAFFALPGARGHGIAFADAALDAGAALVVSDRPHARGLRVEDPGAAMLRLGAWARGRLARPIVAVTGSAGKTTAKALLAAALAGDASEGNLNTPHALAGILLWAWASGGTAPLILELGIDRVGEMDELVDLVRPDLGFLTSIAPGHLDGLGDVATVAREKGRLLGRSPRALAAEEAWRDLPDTLRVRTVRYGLDAEDAEWRGRAVGAAFAPSLEATAPWSGTIDLPGLGRGLAESALGALAAADLLGVEVQSAARRLTDAPLEPGRLQVRRAGKRIVLDDSYNANPASAAHALEVLRAAPGPRVAVLGDMLELGSDSARLHRALGEATRGLDHVLAVGPAAREIAAGNPAARTVEPEDAAAAVAALPPRGTVLIKASRGMRFERLVDVLLRTGEDEARPRREAGPA